MIQTKCLTCETEILVTKPPKIGQVLRCPECQAGLEIVWLFPIALDFVVDQMLQPAPAAPIKQS